MATMSKVARQNCSKSCPVYHQPYTMSKKNIHMLYCKQYNYSSTIFLNFLLDRSVKCWTVHSIVMAATTIFHPTSIRALDQQATCTFCCYSWLLSIKVSHNVQAWSAFVIHRKEFRSDMRVGKRLNYNFCANYPFKTKHQNHLEKFWN